LFPASERSHHVCRHAQPEIGTSQLVGKLPRILLALPSCALGSLQLFLPSAIQLALPKEVLPFCTSDEHLMARHER
jgi:hypothetical protein